MSGFFPLNSPLPLMLRTQQVPGAGVRGAINGGWFTPYSRQRLVNDPTGTFTLTLTNVVIGSLWEVEIVSLPGAWVKSGIAASAAVVITLNSYTSGHAYNSLRVKVRNSTTAPYYQALETQVTAVNGAASIFINQIRDDI